MTKMRWFALVVYIAAGISASLLIAHYGEPQSAWLYCDAIGFDICED